jgi:hypothetical protein
MSHDRARANQRLAEIFREWITVLSLQGVAKKDLAGEVGERTLNLIVAGQAGQLPHKKVSQAAAAIRLPIDLLNEAMIQIPLARQPGSGARFPRRRIASYRSRGQRY